MVKKKKKNNELLYAALTWIAVIVVVLFSIKFVSSSFRGILMESSGRGGCPYKVEGNVNASFTIKYIDSPYCFWCWLEEPILERLVAAKGNSFKLEKYDIRYCDDIVDKYRFSGTPSFVFGLEGEEKEYSHSGFIPEDDLNEIICKATGDCR